MSGLPADLAALLAEDLLPDSPIPPALASLLVRQRTLVVERPVGDVLRYPADPAGTVVVDARDVPIWTTDQALPRPYRIGAVAASITPDSESFAIVGIDGHGTNSWAWHFYVVLGPVAALVQPGRGLAYRNAELSTTVTIEHLDRMSRVQEAVREAADAGRIAPDERLLYVDSDFHGSCGAWLHPGRTQVGGDVGPFGAPQPAGEGGYGWDEDQLCQLLDHLAARRPGDFSTGVRWSVGW